MKEIKVVTGAGHGDEGKGLVSYALAHEAVNKGNKVLTVFANGTTQRCHTINDVKLHCIGAGDLVGGSTYYWPSFVIDPIALWITESKVIYHPNCRIITPWDVMENRRKEIARGEARHGSCGFGLFETVKRHLTIALNAKDLSWPWTLYEKLNSIKNHYAMEADEDEVYNIHNFHLAVDWMMKNCKCATLAEIENDFETVIFENGQGLRLDQMRINETHHLTPSSTGSFNIADWVNRANVETKDVYYVSRTYLTRHGAGELPTECRREDINPDIVDKTNMHNEWQGRLRFGWLDMDTMENDIVKDFARYSGATSNLVYTQLNYTSGQLAIGEGKYLDIAKPAFINGNVFGSETKDSMFKMI